MTMKTRIQKLEQSAHACPTCGREFVTRSDLVEKARDHLARYIEALQGDEAAALARLRKHAPTLAAALD